MATSGREDDPVEDREHEENGEDTSDDSDSDDDDFMDIDGEDLARLQEVDGQLFGGGGDEREERRSVFVTADGRACTASLRPNTAPGEDGREEDASEGGTPTAYLQLTDPQRSLLFREYMDVTRRGGLRRRLEDARAAVSSTYRDAQRLKQSFPMCSSSFVDWIQSISPNVDEAGGGGGSGGGEGGCDARSALRSLHEIVDMATRDWPRSTAIWAAVAEAVEGRIAVAGDPDDSELERECRALLERCVQGCGVHPVDGGHVWDRRIHFEYRINKRLIAKARDGGKDDAHERYDELLQGLRDVVRRRLAVPLESNADFCRSHGAILTESAPDALYFSSGIGEAGTPPATALATGGPPIEVDAQVAMKLRLLMAHEKAIRTEIESPLASSPAAAEGHCRGPATASPSVLRAYMNYINVEEGYVRTKGDKGRKANQRAAYAKPDPSMVVFLYERALELFPATTELWLLYMDFLATALGNIDAVREAHARAVRCLCRHPPGESTPGSQAAVISRVFCNRVLQLEVCQAPVEEVYEVVQDGLSMLYEVIVPVSMAAASAAHAASTKPKVAPVSEAGRDAVSGIARSYLDLLLRGLDALKRATVAKAAAEGAESSASLGQVLRGLFEFGDLQLRELFPDLIMKGGRWTETFLTEYVRFWAWCELSILGDADAARQVFERLVSPTRASGSQGHQEQSVASNFLVWVEYINFESRSLSCYPTEATQRVRGLYKRCHRRRMDDVRVENRADGAGVSMLPNLVSFVSSLEGGGSGGDLGAAPLRDGSSIVIDGLHLSGDICRRWLNFEREHGTAAELLDAERKTAMRLQEIADGVTEKARAAAARQTSRKRGQKTEEHGGAAGGADEGRGSKRPRQNETNGGGASAIAKRVDEDADEGTAPLARPGVEKGRQPPPQGLSNARPVYNDDECTVFVKHLPPTTSDEDLRTLFGTCGAIRECRVVREKPREKGPGDASSTGDMWPCKGFAYIEFAEDESVRKAEETLNGAEFQGNVLFVARSKPKAKHTRGPRQQAHGGTRRPRIQMDTGGNTPAPVSAFQAAGSALAFVPRQMKKR